jgi:hypothetical protein
MNNDEKLDIVVLDLGSNMIRIFSNNDDPTFTDRVSYRIGDSPSHLAISDININRQSDILTAPTLSINILYTYCPS